MTPNEAQAAADLVGMVGSGGGLVLLGIVIAKAAPLAKRWLSLMEAQEELAKAQLAALGKEPARVPELAAQVVEDLREIRHAVEAHAPA